MGDNSSASGGSTAPSTTLGTENTWNVSLERIQGAGTAFFCTIEIIQWDPDRNTYDGFDSTKLWAESHSSKAICINDSPNVNIPIKQADGSPHITPFDTTDLSKPLVLKMEGCSVTSSDPTLEIALVRLKVKSWSSEAEAKAGAVGGTLPDGSTPVAIDDDAQVFELTTLPDSVYYLKFKPCAGADDMSAPWTSQPVGSTHRWGGGGPGGGITKPDSSFYESPCKASYNTKNLEYLKIVDDEWGGAGKPVVGDVFKSDLSCIIQVGSRGSDGTVTPGTVGPTACGATPSNHVSFKECYEITEYMDEDKWKLESANASPPGGDFSKRIYNHGTASNDATTINPKTGGGGALYRGGRFQCASTAAGGTGSVWACIGNETMDEYHLSEALAKSLISMGWGEGLSNFRATAFETTIDHVQKGLAGAPSATKVAWTRMVGAGHTRVHRASLPGSSSNYNWNGEVTFQPSTSSGYGKPLVDSVSLWYAFTTSASQSYDFFDRYRQQIEIEVNKARKMKGSEATLDYEVVRAWDPEYKKIFIEQTMQNSASLAVGGKINENFEFGISMNVSQTTREGVDGYENPTTETSTNVSCRAYVTWRDLLTYASGDGDPDAEGRWTDAVTVAIDLGQAGGTVKKKMSYFKTDPATGNPIHATTTERAHRLDSNGNPVNGNAHGPGSPADIFAQEEVAGDWKDSLFEIQSISINYDLKSNNGWAISVSSSYNPATGATNINPSVSYTSEIPGWENVVYSLDWNPDKSSPGLSLAYRSDDIFQKLTDRGLGTETFFGRPMKLFLNAGISVEEVGGLGAGKTLKPSWSFNGTWGRPAGQSILEGFNYDINIQEGRLAISNAVNLYTHTTETDQVQVSWGFDADLGDPTAPFWGGVGLDNSGVHFGLDVKFEKNIAEFGDVWGKLILRSNFTAGLRAGTRVGTGGGISGGMAQFGLFGRVGIEWDNGILGWLKFPLNVIPGIGAAFGWNFVLRAESTYGGTVTGAQAVMALGPIMWNLKPVDKLREHLRRQRDPWVEDIPLIGGILSTLPVVGVLGPLENEIQYLARAGSYRAFASLGAAAKSCRDKQKTAFRTMWQAIVSYQRGLGVNSVKPCLAQDYTDDGGTVHPGVDAFWEIDSSGVTHLVIKIPAGFYQHANQRKSSYWYHYDSIYHRNPATERARKTAAQRAVATDGDGADLAGHPVPASDVEIRAGDSAKIRKYLSGERW